MRTRGGGDGDIRRRRGNCGGERHRNLWLDVESARKKYSTVEQLVKHLRSPKKQHHGRVYVRYKLQPFTKCVEEIVEALSRRNSTMDESNDDGDTPVIKKRRKLDDGEENLQLVEAQAQRSKVLNHSRPGGSSSSVASASSSERDVLSSDEEACTSVDAIHGEKFEQDFDLTKSMLREKLSQKSKKLGEGGVAKEAKLEVVDNKDVRESDLMNSMLPEKLSKKSQKLRGGREVKQVMELEVLGNKDANEVVQLMNEEGKLSGGGLSKISNNDSSRRDGGEEVSRRMFKDFGGIDGAIEELRKNIILPFYHPQLPRELAVKPITGILLLGPPGCGKTYNNETRVPFYKISAAELVSGVSGASEENIRELFSKANRSAPSIVFIDEIDAIASKRENLRGMELLIVTQLITCMDESSKRAKPVDDNAGSRSSYCRPGYVLVIGATNRPDALDPALRRPGRFDREIALGVPDEYARVQILSKLTCNLKVEGALDLLKIAWSTPGFVGAYLEALCNEAGYLAMNRIMDKRKVMLSKEQDSVCCEESWRPPLSNEELEHISITMADFEEAVKLIQPSSKREGFSDIPNVKWDDVGGLHLLREEFDRHIIRPIKFPEVYKNLGFNLETCFLLYGPPGFGKTLIAMAVANEAGANFIHIKGPELLNKYVGESELAVRTIFSRARTCSPCILFFDEVDSLTTRRGIEGGWVVEWVLNQLLIELDGAGKRGGVYVIGATNRPEVMDPALLRSGRLGKHLYVPLPSPDERGMILKAVARNNLVDANVDLMAIGKDRACENFSGADLCALMSEAVLAAVEEIPLNRTSSSIPSWSIKDSHFKRALDIISLSVSEEQIESYKLLSKSFKASRE